MQTPNSHEGETMVSTHVNQIHKANKRIDALVDVLDELSVSNSHNHALDKLTHKMLDTLVKNDVDHVARIKRLEALVGSMALRITELEQINKMPEHRHQYEDKDELPY